MQTHLMRQYRENNVKITNFQVFFTSIKMLRQKGRTLEADNTLHFMLITSSVVMLGTPWVHSKNQNGQGRQQECIA